MFWTYKQTGQLLTPTGEPAAHEFYSGFGIHTNCPTDEDLLGQGPIPCGSYTMLDLVKDTHLGPVAIKLFPDPATRQRILELGRSPDSFYIHDDTAVHNHKASEGCIVSVSGSGPVLNLWESPYHEFHVVSGL